MIGDWGSGEPQRKCKVGEEQKGIANVQCRKREKASIGEEKRSGMGEENLVHTIYTESFQRKSDKKKQCLIT